MSRFSRTGLACWAAWGVACTAMFLYTSISAAEAQTYLLRFKFVPQQTLYYVSQNDAEYVVEHSQTKETIPHTSMTVRHIQVRDLNPDGSANVELVIDRARMTAKNEGVDSVYDSTDLAHIPTEFKDVHQSIGKPLTARLTTRGQVLPREGNSSDIEQYDLMFQFPEQPLAVGDTWKDNFEVSVLIASDSKLHRLVKLQRRYTLESVDNGIATISMNAVNITPINDAFVETQLVQRKPRGSIRFDLENGYQIDRQIQIDEKVVGHAGPGTALTVRMMKVDRWMTAEQQAIVDLSKPLVPVKVALRP